MIDSCSVLSGFCNSIGDCSTPDSPVHGVLQARILEWVSIPFSRGSSQSRDVWIQVSCIAGRFFIAWATREAVKWEDASKQNTKYHSNLSVITNLLSEIERLSGGNLGVGETRQFPLLNSDLPWWQAVSKMCLRKSWIIKNHLQNKLLQKSKAKKTWKTMSFRGNLRADTWFLSFPQNNLISFFWIRKCGDFPGTMAKTLHSQCRALGFNSWSGSLISHASTKMKIKDPACYN